MLTRAVFSEGDAARPITASQPPERACKTSKHYRSRLARPLFFTPEAQKAVDYFGVLESGTAQILLSPASPVGGFNARRSVGLNEQESAGWQMRLSFWRAGG
jgi:hypothetical protein